MKFVNVVTAAAVIAVFIAVPVGAASASKPSPTPPPAPTANEFAAPGSVRLLFPGEIIPVAPNQKTMQRELATLAREHHASSVTLDASTGLILAVTDLKFTAADLLTIPSR
jgi:hypothetical protein